MSIIIVSIKSTKLVNPHLTRPSTERSEEWMRMEKVDNKIGINLLLII